MAAASAFPPPPAYYKLYTDSNEEEGLCPPPPPPISGEYMLFGAPYRTEEVFPSLEEQGVRQVYPKDQDLDVKAELRALCRELLVLTLELADVLAERPSQYARRVEDISLLLKNIHHLLNTLRPHQARATLIHILEMQVETRQRALADLRQRRQQARQLLAASKEALQEDMAHVAASYATSNATIAAGGAAPASASPAPHEALPHAHQQQQHEQQYLQIQQQQQQQQEQQQRGHDGNNGPTLMLMEA